MELFRMSFIGEGILRMCEFSSCLFPLDFRKEKFRKDKRFVDIVPEGNPLLNEVLLVYLR